MSKKDDDYLDDPEIVDFNEELDARAARDMEEDGMPTSPLMFGPTGRGLSPKIELRANRKLYSDAAKALRSEGINDDSHLKNTKAWNPKSEEQQKEEDDEKQFDSYMSNMYKEMKKPVARSNSKLAPKKGGARKRSSRRRSTKKRSRKGKSRKSKRSRRK